MRGDAIWEDTLDGTYRCRVERLGPDTGLLTVTDTGTGRVHLRRDVPLAYGARFGPDAGDVAAWEAACAAAVDRVYP